MYAISLNTLRSRARTGVDTLKRLRVAPSASAHKPMRLATAGSMRRTCGCVRRAPSDLNLKCTESDHLEIPVVVPLQHCV
eukprot:5560623-Amphidinium_carterae.2